MRAAGASGEGQSRFHLITWCGAWAPQARRMWKGIIRKACGWKHPRAPSVWEMFEDEQATKAVLTFLRDTRVGCMVSLAPLEEEEEGPAPPQNKEGEEGGPGPP